MNPCVNAYLINSAVVWRFRCSMRLGLMKLDGPRGNLEPEGNVFGRSPSANNCSTSR